VSEKRCPCGKQILTMFRMCFGCAAATMPPIEEDEDPRAIEGVPMREQQAPRIPDLCPDESRNE
jgi:hypothetical protein